jgi:hypothetical protein
MSILLIDGVKYEEWRPTNEDELERMVKEHAKDIFGERSEYFDIKHKLRSRAGKGSIPDGFAIVFGDQPQWHVVEIELSYHAYEHIAGQVSKFINGITNATTQKDIVDVLYNEIDSDEFRKLWLRKAIGTTDTHKFLADLISEPAMLTIIIEKHTEEVDEALNMLAYPLQNKKVVEFQTFAREGAGLAVHAHLFQPLAPLGKPTTGKMSEASGEKHEQSPAKIIESLPLTQNRIRKNIIPISRKDNRRFPQPPGEFILETDLGEIKTHGHGTKDFRISDSLVEWFHKHNTVLKEGSVLIIEPIEPMKRYRLKIA